ncbi:MAG: FAD-binding oxidoreductase [Rhodanobacter sp.]
MHRRHLLKAVLAAPFLPLALSPAGRLLAGARTTLRRLYPRVRPGDSAWPKPAMWDALKRRVGGRLLKLQSPFAPDAPATARAEALKHLKNPFYIGDQPALTQTSGWADAWVSQPSAYAVAAETSADVAAAIDFAREHRLRLVVKGGGHSYQGTSDAPDSLLIWTRRMNQMKLHDAFVPQGCHVAAQPAVSVGAGAMWIDAYTAVTTAGGRYVQGGGCTTVGAAGLIQSGGFGSFSKRWGTAAGNLLEAELVTADGQVRIVNAVNHPDLFWGLKGGGGGSLGVVTRMTLRTFELPEFFGGVFGRIKASSPTAFRALVAEAMQFYRRALFNPHWGEQISLRDGDTLSISMVFQDLSQDKANQVWAPFVAWVRARPEYTFVEALKALAIPARHFWDAEFFRKYAPTLMVADDRADMPTNHVLWAGDQGQVGWFIHGYQSAWLPATLLASGAQTRLADALFAASQQWDVELHFNKGLAGGAPEAIERGRDTATHPDVLGAFALALIGSSGDPAYPGLNQSAPDLAKPRRDATGVDRAMAALRAVAPDAGSYVSESDYFLRDWQRGFWGENYSRLALAKRRYDPDGLFVVHHGVGSEAWSADGFTPTSDNHSHA